MLVLDRSGSMAEDGGHGRPKIDEARDAASLFVQLIRATGRDMVGLESFSTTATQPAEQEPLAMDPAGKAVLVGAQPQYSGGKLGLIQVGGDTSIGDGLREAMRSFPSSHEHSRRAILLLTDGLENTAPKIADVEAELGDTRLNVVGYGTSANLNGALLTRLARDHDGWFMRAETGIGIRKFFGLAFGNVFQAGALADPEFVLEVGQADGETIECPVLDETEITAVVGWDVPYGSVKLRITAPDGTELDVDSDDVIADRGHTWAFLRLELPYAGQREGVWRVTALRDPDSEAGTLRYFLSVLAEGGPKLWPLPPSEAIEPGDRLPLRVGLHYPDGTFPPAEIEVTVTAPDGSLNELVDAFGMLPETGGPDPLSAWAATLEEIQNRNGGVLPIGTVTTSYTLDDDYDDGLEDNGIYGATLDDVTTYEGTLEFHAVATYAGGRGRREAMWSITVGLDDGRYTCGGGGEEGIPSWTEHD